MSVLFALIFSLALPITSVIGGSVIENRKNANRGNRFIRLIRRVTTFVFPPFGILWSLAMKKRPVQGNTPEEQAVFNGRFNVERKKEALERMESRRDRLELFKKRSLIGKVIRPGLWLPDVQSRWIADRISIKRTDIRSEYEMLGRSELKAGMTQKARFAFVRMEEVPLSEREVAELLKSGKTQEEVNAMSKFRFGIPYDLPDDKKDELKALICEKYGVDIFDKEAFYISGHRAGELSGYKAGVANVCFDTKEHNVSLLGVPLDEEVSKKISKLESDVKEICYGETPARDSGMLVVERCGVDSVCIGMNGIPIAYAVAGENGSIRTSAISDAGLNRLGGKFANRIYDSLSTAGNMSEWIDRASDLVLSSANIRLVREGLEKDRSLRQELKHRKAVRNNILRAPKQTLRTLKNSI